MTLKNIVNVENSYYGAICFILERFFIHLNKEKKYGIIIHDDIDQKTEKRLKRKVYNFISKEKFTCKVVSKPFIDRIYPDVFFSDDIYSNILQASDLIAVSLNSAIWKNWNSKKGLAFNVENLPEHNEYLEEYWKLFAKDRKDRVNGWGIKVWR